ncbi:hypothetical protein [Cohnella sp. AR92]|uniref:hypothetical protein n=1 Tax=Cohnella sp. AR92 TaxID=648716 RepID=UPI000F8EFE35|nr:hypothetical protein [Cohnella sp. AR92]RUS49156.1 hypothetical protein ELR57_02115 [Cohnella sp. AR92]
MTCPHDFAQNGLGEQADGFEPAMIESPQAETFEEWNEADRVDTPPDLPREPVAYLHVNRSTVLLRNLETADLSDAMSYIRSHKPINHVHLAGSDCFRLPRGRLEEIVASLRQIDHVQMIRLHSRVPISEPSRINGNKALLDLIGLHSKPGKSIYMMVKIRHPKEITDEVIAAFRALHEAGANLIAEIPMLRGENDSADTLSQLMNLLTRASVIPYQFILERPAQGQEEQALDLARAYRLTEAVKTRTMGLGRRIRLSLVRTDGLMEVLAVEDGKAYIKWHSSPEEVGGRFLIVDADKQSLWADDWEQAASSADEEESGPRKPAADIELRPGYLPSKKSYLKTPHEIPD